MPANALRRLLPSLSVSGVGRRIVLGFLVGVVAGLGAMVFNLACSAGSWLFLDSVAGYRPAAPAGEHHFIPHTDTPLQVWLLPLCAAVGGLLSGLIVWKFAPEASGHGTDAAIDAYHRKDGKISSRVPLVKIIASALTIGSGGSGGREGPIAQIGAGFGSWLADRFGLSSRERRLLVASGMGAGVGSIFHAPLAGALFAAEILYSEAEFESDVLIPAAVSTIVGYSVFASMTSFEPLFAEAPYTFDNPVELLLYTVLAVLVTLAAGLFVKVFYGVHDFSERLRWPAPVKPMIGGLITGLIGVSLYQAARVENPERVLDVLSFGYGSLQDALLGTAPIALLLMIAFGKMLTTSISIGSGGSGGVFGPAMVIGGAVGGIVGQLGEQWFPDIVAHPGSYALVGMAGFFAAAGNAPFSTLVMVSEMTGNYKLIVPALWVSALAFLLGRPFKLYRSQVPTRVDSDAHKHEMFVDLMADTRISQLMEDGLLDAGVETVHEAMPLDALVHVFALTTQHYYPVVDDDGRMVSILSANDVRKFIEDTHVGQSVIASDLANPAVVVLRPSTDLETALKRFVSLDVEALPVVDQQDDTKLLGMMSRRALIRHYQSVRQDFQERNQA